VQVLRVSIGEGNKLKKGKEAVLPRKLKLLFLLPFPPRLDATHGGARALAQLLQAMAERHHVALLYLRAAGESPVDCNLRNRCALTYEIQSYGSHDSFTWRWFRRARQAGALFLGRPTSVARHTLAQCKKELGRLVLSWRPDVLQIESRVMGCYASCLDGRLPPRILPLHEPPAEAAQQLKKCGYGLTRVVRFLDAVAWTKFESSLTRQFDALVVFTERDKRILERSGYSVPVVSIPIATCLSAPQLNPLGSSPPSLLFVGNFIHPPNVAAALRLAQQIFPQVHKRFPDTSLYLVGDQPPPEIRKLSSPVIFVTGLVPEITPFLNQAAVVVAPLQLGGGMRVKVLETLAAGKALVASPLAVEGLDLQDGMQAAVAKEDEDFQHSICELLEHPDQRISMARRARQWALENLDWEKPVRAYERLYYELISKRAAYPTSEIDSLSS